MTLSHPISRFSSPLSPHGSGFSYLPSELILHVFQYLDPVSILRLRTCKRLNEVAGEYLSQEYHLPLGCHSTYQSHRRDYPEDKTTGLGVTVSSNIKDTSDEDLVLTAYELQTRLSLIDLHLIERTSASWPTTTASSSMLLSDDQGSHHGKASLRIAELAEGLLSRAFASHTRHGSKEAKTVTVDPMVLSLDYLRILANVLLDSVLLGLLYPETAVILIQQLDLGLDRAQMMYASRVGSSGDNAVQSEGYKSAPSSTPPSTPFALQQLWSYGKWSHRRSGASVSYTAATQQQPSAMTCSGSNSLGQSNRVHQLCYNSLVPIVSHLLLQPRAEPTISPKAYSSIRSPPLSPLPFKQPFEHIFDLHRASSSPRQLTRTLCFLPLLGRHFNLLSTETFLSTFLADPTRNIRLDRATVLVCSFMCVLDLTRGIAEAFHIFTRSHPQAKGVFQAHEIFRIVERYCRLCGKGP